MCLNFRQVGSACQDLDLESRRFAAPSYAQEETVFFRFDRGSTWTNSMYWHFNASPNNVGFDTLEGFSTVQVRDGVEMIKTNLLRVSEGHDGFLGEGTTDNEHNGS
jgi:hypothetical protein